MGRLDDKETRPTSLPVRLGGVRSRVGGVPDDSETSEDPAVEGLSAGSFLGMDFFRPGTPSGQVHW